MEASADVPGSDDSGRRWIVDPLCGTTNLLHGLPHYAISIALEERGEVIAGLIYDPIKDDLFFAEKGQGAFHNDRRLRVSARNRLNECLVATGAPFAGKGDRPLLLGEIDAVMAQICSASCRATVCQYV